MGCSNYWLACPWPPWVYCCSVRTTAVIRYRLAQFWRHLTAGPLPPEAWAEIESVLSPAELALFKRFAPGDRWHGYGVWCTLREAEQKQADLAVAALLHDVGKTRVDKFTAVERSMEAVLRLLFPQRAQGWEQGDVQSWRKPFVVRAHHAAWGADMAQSAGSSDTAVALIRRHQDPLDNIQTEEDRLLSYLQWADDQN